MIVFAALGSLTFILVGAVIGTRLLLLSRRTRQLPEFLIGLGLFLFAVVVQPAIVVSRPIGEHFGNNARLVVLAIAFVSITIVITTLYHFTYVVFRPHSKLARSAVWVAGFVMAATSVSLLSSLSMSKPGDSYSLATRLSILSYSTNFLISMFWIAIESLRYRKLLLRRYALGLADPVMINRFGLWGLGCAVAGLSAVGSMLCVAAGLNIASHPIPLLNTAFAGTLIGATWYLSLLAPEPYKRWVRARAARASA